MAKSTLFKYVLMSLCLGAANLLAQDDDPDMRPPPIPSSFAAPPPNPATLPPPPALEWESLPARGSEDQGGVTVTAYVPPPEPESLIPPPSSLEETPVVDGFDPNQLEIAKPEVEIWRGESDWPQVPARHFNQLDLAYITGTDPVWLKVQFDPQAAGKSVSARPGRGLTLTPPNPVLTIESTGECLIMAQLQENVFQSHIIFYCEGVKTILPISRASLATVQGVEEETGGGH